MKPRMVLLAALIAVPAARLGCSGDDATRRTDHRRRLETSAFDGCAVNLCAARDTALPTTWLIPATTIETDDDDRCGRARRRPQ